MHHISLQTPDFLPLLNKHSMTEFRHRFSCHELTDKNQVWRFFQKSGSKMALLIIVIAIVVSILQHLHMICISDPLKSL